MKRIRRFNERSKDISSDKQEVFELGKESKQETFEEAAKDFIENTMKFSFNSLETKTLANRMLKCVEFGAKWEQARSYSEKDMVEFSKWRVTYEENNPNNVKHSEKLLQIWFEQFKKK